MTFRPQSLGFRPLFRRSRPGEKPRRSRRLRRQSAVFVSVLALLLAPFPSFPGSSSVTPGEVERYAGGEGPRFQNLPQATAVGQTPAAVIVKTTEAGDYVYVSDSTHHVVRVVSPDGKTRIVAGTGVPAFERDGVAATKASLNAPTGLAIGETGALYITDSGNQRVRKVSPGQDGVVLGAEDELIETFAGGGAGTPPASSDAPGIEPTSVAFTGQMGPMALRSETLVFLVGNTIFRIDKTGLRMVARGLSVAGIALDEQGAIFFSDPDCGVCLGSLKKIEAGSTQVKTVAGSRTLALAGGECEPTGDGSAASSATFCKPGGLAFDHIGDLLVTDFHVDPNGPGPNQRRASIVRRISSGADKVVGGDADETITTIAGTPASCSDPSLACGDGGPANAAQFNRATNLALSQDQPGQSQRLYLADTGDFRVRRVESVASDGLVKTVAGDGSCCHWGDERLALESSLGSPAGIALDQAGNFYMAETRSHRVRKISASTHTVSTLAGDGTPGLTGDGGDARKAHLKSPKAVATDAKGNVYIADTDNDRIRMVSAEASLDGSRSISTVLGSGVPANTVSVQNPAASACSPLKCDSASNPALASDLNRPAGLAAEPDGSLYVADTGNNRVLKVGLPDSTGVRPVSLVAGSGSAGFSGDGGDARLGQLNSPESLAIDSTGDVYVADSANKRIRRVLGATEPDGGHRIETVGSVLPAAPRGLALNRDGGQLRIYVSTADDVIQLNQGGGTMRLAGTGSPGYGGDEGLASQASFKGPTGLVVDERHLYVSDTGNNLVRRVALEAPAALPTVSINDVTAHAQQASSSVARFQLTLSSPATTPVSVQYATRDGSADSSDYEPASGTVVFPPAQQSGDAVSQTISVRIKPRAQKGPDKTFFVELRGAVGALLSRDTAVGTIVDDLPFPSSGGWTEGNFMSTARSGASATVLQGPGCLTNRPPEYCGKVLIAGGGTNSAELFNPDSGLFEPLPPMLENRTQVWSTGLYFSVDVHHTATSLQDGRVLMVGPGSTAEFFNPSKLEAGQNPWERAPDLLLAHEGHTSTLLPDGRVLIAGGSRIPNDMPRTLWNQIFAVCNNCVDRQAATDFLARAAEVFDPKANAGQGGWSLTGPMTTARYFHSSSLISGAGCLPGEPADCKRVLIAGGYSANDPQNAKTAELYNPASNAWTATGSLIEGRSGHQAVVLPDGKVLIAGGCPSGIYEGGTGADSQGILRRPCQKALDPIQGGQASPSEPLKSLEVFDPSRQAWEPAGQMQSARGAPGSGFTAVITPDGKALLAGGGNSLYWARGRPIHAESSVDMYERGPVPSEPMNIPRFNQATAVLADGRVLVAGGDVAFDERTGKAVPSRSIEIYDGRSAFPADLSINLSASQETVASGDELTYTLEVDNRGPSDARLVRLTDSIFPGAGYASSSPGCSYFSDARAVTCQIGTLGAGQNVTKQVTVKAIDPGRLRNTARVDAFNKDPNPSNNQVSSETTVTGRATDCSGNCADLAIEKTASQSRVSVNDKLTYSLRVRNEGPNTSPDVNILDQLPEQVSYRSSSSECAVASEQTVVYCSLGALAPGQTKLVTVTVSADQAGSVSNTASVYDESHMDSNSANNSSTAITDVLPLVAIQDSSVQEGDSGVTRMQFALSLSGPYERTVQVAYSSSDGTASSPEDYRSDTGFVSFAPGETLKFIDVDVSGDTIPEANETFFLDLSSASDSKIARSRGLGTIIDDDNGLSINDVRVLTDSKGDAVAKFTVKSSPPKPDWVSVDFQTADGTAKQSSDYEATQGHIDFPPGDSSKEVNVKVFAQSKKQPDKQFFMTLLRPVNSKITRAQGVATIQSGVPDVGASNFANLPISCDLKTQAAARKSQQFMDFLESTGRPPDPNALQLGPPDPGHVPDPGLDDQEEGESPCGSAVGLAGDKDRLIATTLEGKIYSIDAAGNSRLMARLPCPAEYEWPCEPWPAISPGLGGFKKHDLFSTLYGTIFRIGSDGSLAPFSRLPGVVDGENVGIGFDRVGTFGFDMIAASGGGRIFRINSLGLPVLIANVPVVDYNITETGTPIVAPFSFAPYGGELMSSIHDDGTVYAVSPSGRVRRFIATQETSSLQVVPCDMGTFAGGSLFASEMSGVTRFSTEQMRQYKGSIAATGEGSGIITLFQPDGTAVPREKYLYPVYNYEGGGLASIYQDDPLASVVGTTIEEPDLGEAEGVVEARLGPNAAPLDVHYVVHGDQNGNGATAGQDFVASEGDFRLDDSSPHRISIKVLSDPIQEQDEQFYVDLTSPSCNTFSLRATVTIKDPSSQRTKGNGGRPGEGLGDGPKEAAGPLGSQSFSGSGSSSTYEHPQVGAGRDPQQQANLQQPIEIQGMSQAQMQAQMQAQIQSQMQSQAQHQAGLQTQLAAAPMMRESLQKEVQVERVRDSERKDGSHSTKKDQGLLASALENSGESIFSFGVVAAFLGFAMLLTKPRRRASILYEPAVLNGIRPKGASTAPRHRRRD